MPDRTSSPAAVRRLAHVNIRTADLARSIRFYADVLGLTAALAPGTTDMSEAVWLHDQTGEAVIHAGSGDISAVTGGRAPGGQGSGVIDHVAFLGDDAEAMIRQLDALGQPFRVNRIPEVGLQQVFVTDPDGVIIEINFFDRKG